MNKTNYQIIYKILNKDKNPKKFKERLNNRIKLIVKEAAQKVSYDEI